MMTDWSMCSYTDPHTHPQVNLERKEAAERILNELKTGKLRQTIRSMSKLISAYIHVANQVYM